MPDRLLEQIAVIDVADALFGGRDKVATRYNPNVLITNKGFSTLDKMRRDDQIKVAMRFKKSAILNTGWDIVSPQKDKTDKPTEFIKNTLNKMNMSFTKRLYSILSALDYGFSVSEKIFTEQENNIAITDIKTIKPHDLEFVQDDYGNLYGIEQDTNPLPIDKFIIFTNDFEFENYYGTPELDAAYRAWWLKDNAYKWLAMLLERLGIPPIFALYEPSFYSKTTELQKLYDTLTNLQTATVAAIPKYQNKDRGESLDFWTPELAGNVSSVFIPALEMLNRDISRALLVPGSLGISPEENVGAYSKSKVHFDVFMLQIESIRQDLESHIVQKQIIEPLIDLNFNIPKEEYPIFRFNPINDEVRLDYFNTWKTLLDANAVKRRIEDEKHIRSKLGFPDDTTEEVNDDNEIPSDNANMQFSLSREPNKYEKKIDFEALDKKLTSKEIILKEQLKETLVSEFEKIKSKLRKAKTINEIKLTTSFKSNIEKIITNNLKSAAKDGSKDAKETVKRQIGSKFKADVGWNEKAAIKWLSQYALNTAGVLTDKLQIQINFVIANAIKTGKALPDIINDLEDLLLPYIGNDNVIDDVSVIEPYRLETIARTGMTTAYNQGALVTYRDPDVIEWVAGVEYSAIMDSRTTEVCRHLNGRVFKVDDSDMDILTPPNHYNCRSVLVPIMINETIDKKDFLTNRDKGIAKDLAGKGFV